MADARRSDGREMFPTDPEDHLARLADDVRAFEALKRASPAEKSRRRSQRRKRRRRPRNRPTPTSTDTPQEPDA